MFHRFDVAVIGGGIHGVGVAQAAAAAGYKVVVVEKTGLASATSGHSSRLIHGGLRYLEHGQLGLVRLCLRERELLLKLAPDLVQLSPFFIPVYENSSRSRRLIQSGLSLYALLAGMAKHCRFQLVPRQRWHELDGLRTDGLKAVFQYWDGRTDDAALTRAVMASAQSMGADLWLPAMVEDGELFQEGCILWCRHQGRIEEIRARVVVNAAGPWARRLLDRIRYSTPAPDVALVAGSHIILHGTITKGVYYLESPEDHRPFFVMSHPQGIMSGTTEVSWQGDPGKATVSQNEIVYLQKSLRAYFPSLAQETIHSSFTGLRVLPLLGTNFNQASRETVLWSDRNEKPRLLSIFGGKLTAYRATAELVMKMISTSLPEAEKREETQNIRLFPIE
ncbi:MAG: FAD-dependent oxidoreductase [Magnetococcales bacterium]|nr:FAD-dependent oxidoreductase [Magnetococcales bacterium]